MLASGVFRSWVTDDTKSDRISAKATPARTVRIASTTLRHKVGTAATTASSVHPARRLASDNGEPIFSLTRTVHIGTARLVGSSVAALGSKNSRGNSRRVR